MNTLTHKGYTARIDFDERDSIFVGRVLGIRDIIGFHGDSVPALIEDFHNAIDFMLEDCRERGVSPEKPASGNLMLRIPPEVHAAALVAAQAAGTSLNQWAAKTLDEAAHT